MGLRILHSADWHLGSPFRGFSQTQRQALRRAQEQLPGAIARIVRERQCHLVLLAGDLVEGNPGGEWIRLLRSAFRQMAVPVFIAPGNHDPWVLGSVWLEESWPENVHIFTGAPESVALPALSCRVYGGGYRSMDCPALLEGFRAEGSERWCLGVFHGDPVNRNSPCCPVTAAQVRDSGLDYLALGHIHRAGSFTAGSTLCAWPGCAMGRGWDETGEKGVWLAELEESAELTWIPLPGPRFYDLTVSLEEENALEGLLPPVPSEDHYRITLTGAGEADPRALARRFAHLPNLTFRDQTRPSQDLWEGAGEDCFRGVYFDLLRQQESPAALLAAKLSRQLLAGEEVALP